jgi:uncharacterized protein (TIGR02611 family)
VNDRRRRWARWRDGIRDKPAAELTYRIGVAVVGLVTLVVGIIAIPYPGPGWAIVFIGLAILASEFEWARRLLVYTRKRYDAVMGWFRRQGRWVQALAAVVTAVAVVASLWLFGVLGWTATMLGYERAWLKSPIGLG